MTLSPYLQEVAKRRTFAIISHPDAGKTTITEKVLLFGQAIQTAGTVKGRGSSQHAKSDWMEMEKQRGISITTSVMQFPYHDCLVNLLDTPGHEDFSEDTYRTLTAVDCCLMVIDAAKGVEERDYFRIKLLELFYHIKQLRIEDQYEATYYAKEQIEIIKRIRQELIENLDKKISIEELLRKEPMSKVTFQAIFKQIYGDTPYAHIKKYKMNLAAVYLQETDQSITQIAGELGYSNISKFARAFQEVFGMLPKDYRKAKK